MGARPRRASTPPSSADLTAARTFLRQRQAYWAGLAHRTATTEALAEALAFAADRRDGLERDGDKVWAGVFRYDAGLEEARLLRTEELIRRVHPGPHEDARYLELVARQAASVELILSELLGPEQESAVLGRILIGTTGEPRSDGYAALVEGMIVIAMSAGMIDLVYQTSKAVAMSWKPEEPEGKWAASFSTAPEDMEQVWESDPYPIDLFHDTLATWIYEGFPRASHSSLPDAIYHPPIEMLVNGAERFILAHEYGHALLDYDLHDPSGGDDDYDDHTRELRADAFAFQAVVRSATALDGIPGNLALQGAILAMKAHEVLDMALQVARTGTWKPDSGSPTHPPFARRMALLDELYLSNHPDPDDARNQLKGMRVPSNTIDLLWARTYPRLAAQHRAGLSPHPMWA